MILAYCLLVGTLGIYAAMSPWDWPWRTHTPFAVALFLIAGCLAILAGMLIGWTWIWYGLVR